MDHHTLYIWYILLKIAYVFLFAYLGLGFIKSGCKYHKQKRYLIGCFYLTIGIVDMIALVHNIWTLSLLFNI